MINLIKKIVSDILFIDDKETIKDEDSLILVHGLSSIDFIDLCYELKTQIHSDIEPDKLWPFSKMLLDKEFYDGENWTEKGWVEICNSLKLEQSTSKQRMDELYQYFTPLYISQKIEELKS